MTSRYFTLAPALVVLLAGCAGKASPRVTDAPPVAANVDLRQRAARHFADGLYADAAADYARWLEANADASDADAALFGYALAHLSRSAEPGAARDARILFNRLVRDYPASAYRPAAEALLDAWGDLDRLRRQLDEIKRIDLDSGSKPRS